MKRTTVRLDEQLSERAKRYAASTGQTLTAVIAASLRETLDKAEGPYLSGPVELPTYGGNGLQSGLDLEDWGQILDRMDGLE